jgi:methionyl-tRNA formyltransferase
VRVVFFGTGEFAVPALRAIRESVALVVTQPDRPTGRGLGVKPSSVKRAALDLDLEVRTPEKARDPAFVESIRCLGADALVVAAYGQILSEALLGTAMRGGINLHGSILPFYRGAAPIQRAILDGRKETGVSLMQMDRGMDTGDVIDIVRTDIGPDETYGELQDRLAQLAADQIREWLPRIVAGNFPRTAQDHASATVAPKVAKGEAELRCVRPAEAEYNRFRAFTPNPGAYCVVQAPGGKGGTLRMHRMRLRRETGPIGTILESAPLPVVAFADGSLEWIEVQPEGKKRMSGRDWANGMRLQPGETICHGQPPNSSPN